MEFKPKIKIKWKNHKSKLLFDEMFKYKNNQELRHRGDSKSYSADMGLLVLHRLIHESVDDDGKKQYERSYVCRLVKFSGSGEVAQFREKELITIQEYERNSLEREADRNRMRNEVRQTQREIYDAFGVKEEDYFRLKDTNGNIIDDKKYRVTGFSMSEGTAKITIRESLTSLDKKVEAETKEITSKEQLEIIKA